MTRILLAACFAVAAMGLSACGGSDSTPMPQAARSNLAVLSVEPGLTPLIKQVWIGGEGLPNVVSYRYVIAPKAGTVSRPVDVTYTLAGMQRLGHYSAGTASATLPVFGLYGGHTNRVNVELLFADGSRKELALDIVTAPYVDPKAVHDRPNILKKRAAGGVELNYFYLKSSIAGPIVIDSDGEIRWIAPTTVNGFSSAFDGNGFVMGEQATVNLARIELDGRTTATALSTSSFTKFHHNVDHGKSGLLGEVDGVVGGQPSIESVLVEFNSSGTILKQWDFAELVGRHMLQQGDDPSTFIRPGVDWFHMNASTYDPRDDSIIASSRENFVIKVDYATGNIKWIFGDPTKYWYTFPSLRAKALTLEPGGLYPIGQHATSITSGGHLMLFNNGLASVNQPAGAPVGAARTYSAVSAYEIDAVRMTARETWNFDYGKTLYSPICSSAYESPLGAMLVSYAATVGLSKTRLVGLDLARNVIFDFEYATPVVCGTSWNAEPIAFDAMTIR